MTSRLSTGTPAIADLVERQMRNWELARLQRLDEPAPAARQVEDFVCVSRQIGVDDKEVAGRLAEHLGWPLFDREVLEAMAGDDARRRQVYASMDERDLGWWEETLRSLMQSEFVRNDYFHRLCETLLSLARQGSCVFLGRGADLVLPRDRGFRVRLVAPLDLRVQRFAQTWGLTLNESKREVARLDRQRALYFDRHFGVDANDPLRHDISINLARFDLDQAVEAMTAAREVLLRGR